MLNPLVYREHYSGRGSRGGMMHRRAYTPDRDRVMGQSPAHSSSGGSRFRAHSQPPEINYNEYVPIRRTRRKKK